jgi:hypothetical protein
MFIVTILFIDLLFNYLLFIIFYFCLLFIFNIIFRRIKNPLAFGLQLMLNPCKMTWKCMFTLYVGTLGSLQVIFFIELAKEIVVMLEKAIRNAKM